MEEAFSMSIERLLHAQKALSQRRRELWEGLQVSPVEKFEAFLGRVEFIIDALGTVAQWDENLHDLLSSKADCVIWRYDGDLRDAGVEDALRVLEELGIELEALSGLAGALGAHIVNEVRRRFQGSYKYGQLDEAAYARREERGKQSAVPYLDGWVQPGLRAVALYLSDIEGERAWRVLLALADDVHADPTVTGLIYIYLGSAWARVQDLDHDLLMRILSLYGRYLSEMTLQAEGDLWRHLLVRTPVEGGWSAYCDAVTALERRCAAILDVIEQDDAESAASHARSSLPMFNLVLVAWLGCWRFDRAREWFDRSYMPLVESSAEAGDVLSARVLSEALDSSGLPPEALVEHLIAEGESLSVAVMVLKHVAEADWPFVSPDIVPPLRLAVLSGIDSIVSRALWPAVNLLNYEVATRSLALSTAMAQSINELARYIWTEDVVAAFRDEKAWGELIARSNS